MREADDLYERAYTKVTSSAIDTEYKLRQHMEYKKKLANELGEDVDTTLKEFQTFHIDAKTIAPAEIQNFSVPQIQESLTGLSSFKSAVSGCMPHLDLPSILDLVNAENDYYEARRQRDEARSYKERMKWERDKLYDYREKMSEITSFIGAEKNELDSLMGKLRTMTGQLKSGMQKTSFSTEEAEYLKGIHKIAESVAALLSTEFLNDAFSINPKYQEIYASIKNINQSLPSAHSITDPNTVAGIKRILSGPVTY